MDSTTQGLHRGAGFFLLCLPPHITKFFEGHRMGVAALGIIFTHLFKNYLSSEYYVPRF